MYGQSLKKNLIFLKNHNKKTIYNIKNLIFKIKFYTVFKVATTNFS